MNKLEFDITFHGPFHVSTGRNEDGVLTVDQADPLPATSLKGVMRATATHLLGENSELVKDVFGSGSRPCPWRWSPACPEASGWRGPHGAARVRIDSETQTASHDMLGFTEQTGAERASFTITRFGRVPAEKRALHLAVLAVSAQATRSIGGLRRRGLGWVGIECTSYQPAGSDVHMLLQERES